ncbi:MAG: hypothetical protein HWE22_10645 [Flavobacteriales bacterium]|nr:hypothetical protein [Flavobacteriales bacterium]
MNDIVNFLEEFFAKEAKMSTLKRVPNLNDYNRALEEYYAFLVPQLRGSTGHMPMTELDDEDVYMMLEGLPDDTKRYMYKISKYSHSKYGTVWVAYVSKPSPPEGGKYWNTALFLIEEEGLKVARYMLWSNYTERGDQDAPYEWDGLWGYRDLNFETIQGPSQILRILEPIDHKGGLEQYNAEM